MHDPYSPTQSTPETHENPSLQAECLDQRPATGLRLPAPRSEALPLHVRSSVEAGGECAQRTTTPRQPPNGALGGGSPEAAPTGLVQEGRLGPEPKGLAWTLRDDECPLEGAQSFDRTTGAITWRPTCKNARCRRCSRQVSAQTFALARKALERDQEVVPGLPVARSAEVDRLRFITLTQVPEGWEETRQAMRHFTRFHRRRGRDMNLMYVIEKGAETGMKHAHLVQWGDYLPKAEVSESWPYGHTQIEAARAATDYLAKGVLRYVAKGLDGNGEDIEEHMNLNGGRAAHWSKGFFAGESRDAFRKRNPLPGVYFVEVDR